uniref:Uncharacterized protein n=1 Tax=Romanomermis culicivorax TaxID=13658 RepID=A0A915K623_ROMCU
MIVDGREKIFLVVITCGNKHHGGQMTWNVEYQPKNLWHMRRPEAQCWVDWLPEFDTDDRRINKNRSTKSKK